MNLKNVLVAISLMVVATYMGGAFACPCADLNPDEWRLLDPQPVGTEICIQAPLAPSGETWEYEWMVYERGTGTAYDWRNAASGELSNSGSKLCITPGEEHCGEVMAVRVTIQTVTDGTAWDGCIRLLCVQWECYNPECPEMTPFCEGHADDDNLPTGESDGFTYLYTIDGDTAAPMTVDRLNALGPGEYEICVYTEELGPNYQVCCFDLKVYAKPTGSLVINP